MKAGPIGCPETSVTNYHYSLRNNPEERGSRLFRMVVLIWDKMSIISVLPSPSSSSPNKQQSPSLKSTFIQEPWPSSLLFRRRTAPSIRIASSNNSVYCIMMGFVQTPRSFCNFSDTVVLHTGFGYSVGDVKTSQGAAWLPSSA